MLDMYRFHTYITQNISKVYGEYEMMKNFYFLSRHTFFCLRKNMMKMMSVKKNDEND